MYFKAHRLDEAIADYSQAVRLQSDFATAYRDRGIARTAKGEHDEAMADLNRAICLDPNDDRALAARAQIHRDRVGSKYSAQSTVIRLQRTRDSMTPRLPKTGDPASS